MSPTARTLKHLRELGYLPCVVERWIPGACVRKDCFGFADVLAIRSDRIGVLAVQATTDDNMSARLKKARALPELAVWLKAGNRFLVVGWKKRLGRWCVRTFEVFGEELAK